MNSTMIALIIWSLAPFMVVVSALISGWTIDIYKSGPPMVIEVPESEINWRKTRPHETRDLRQKE